MKRLQQVRSRFLFALLCFLPYLVSAQELQDVEMADTFRAEGKIYVVIAVMAIILCGLFAYLFKVGKNVTALEKKFQEKK